jgi:hypothetical protein
MSKLSAQFNKVLGIKYVLENTLPPDLKLLLEFHEQNFKLNKKQLRINHKIMLLKELMQF